MTADAGARSERKIAIFGTTPSRMEGPTEGQDDWERWTIGPGGKDTHGWERLFETHQVWPVEFAEYLSALSQVKEPQQVFSVAPMPVKIQEWAREHEKDEAWLAETIKGDWSANVVIDRPALYDKYARLMFQSSIDYCLALAIEEGATDIGCWGIDLESGEEYISQWQSAKIWLMLARLAGINVHLPKGSGLERDLTPYPERYETHFALATERKTRFLDSMIGQAETELRQQQAELNRIEGAMFMLKKLMIEDRKATDEDIKIAEKDLVGLHQRVADVAGQLSHLRGERSATMYYRRMYCWGMVEPV